MSGPAEGIPRFEGEYTASLVARFSPHTERMAAALLALDELVVLDVRDGQMYEAMLDLLARNGFWQLLTAAAVAYPDGPILAEASLATVSSPPDADEAAERAYRAWAVHVVNAAWLLGQQVQISPGAWPADLAAIALDAVRAAPSLDPGLLTELGLGAAPDVGIAGGDDRADNDAGQTALPTVTGEQTRFLLDQFTPLVDRVCGLVWRIRVLHEAGQREIDPYVSLIHQLGAASLSVLLAARAHVLLDAAGPDRIRQAESAVTAAADRAPRAGESTTARRHAAAVLHLLWVGGQQLCITPEDWPNELADTVLAAARATHRKTGRDTR
jgi:hypothetical protein